MRYHFSLETSSAPAVEPLTKDEVKEHLRIDEDETAEDSVIDSFIKTARRFVERIYGLRLIDQTVKMYLDDFPRCSTIKLPLGQLQSVSSITYQDTDNTTQTVSSSDYQVDTKSNPARIALEPESTWPTVRAGELNAVTITMVCGYGSSGSSVPQDIRCALLLIVGHLYEHREDTQSLTVENIPMGAKALLADYRGEWFS